jgi:hypothetical protein
LTLHRIGVILESTKGHTPHERGTGYEVEIRNYRYR